MQEFGFLICCAIPLGVGVTLIAVRGGKKQLEDNVAKKFAIVTFIGFCVVLLMAIVVYNTIFDAIF